MQKIMFPRRTMELEHFMRKLFCLVSLKVTCNDLSEVKQFSAFHGKPVNPKGDIAESAVLVGKSHVFTYTVKSGRGTVRPI